MTVDEANFELIHIGNAVIVDGGYLYYVTPRTTLKVKPIQEYEGFWTVKEAYDYAVKLPIDFGLKPKDFGL